MAVFAPYDYKKRMTMKVVKCMIIGSWLFSGLIYPLLATIKYLSLSLTERKEIIRYVHEMYPDGTIQYLQVPLYISCLIITTILYICICVGTVRQGRKVGPHIGTAKYHEARKLTKMMIIIVGLLLLAWIPLTVFSVIPRPSFMLDPGAFTTYTLAHDVCLIFMWTNPSFNVFIYAWRHHQFRKVYLMLLGCKKTQTLNSSG